IPGSQIEIVTISGDPGPGHPDSTEVSVGGCVEERGQFKCLGIVGRQPPKPPVTAMGAETKVEMIVMQQQPGALQLIIAIEINDPLLVVYPYARHGQLNQGWAVVSRFACPNVKGVKLMHSLFVLPVPRRQIDCVCIGVNDWRA